MPAPTISDYALLGDCQGAALVSRGGSVDWWCAPRFDSPSALGRLLDPRAGHWTLCFADERGRVRRYLDGTMVLETEVETATGRAVVREAMAFAPGARGHRIGLDTPHALLRVVDVTQGRVRLRCEMVPRLEYGLVLPGLRRDGGIVRTEGGADRLLLRADVPVEVDDEAARVVADVEIDAGGGAGFALRHQRGSGPDEEVPDARRAIDDAVEGWRSWEGEHERYAGPWAGLVRRSALVLQALTYAPSGAIVAAPTTSLPERPGGGDNWDYRFAWLRDASLTLHALWVAACPDEAARNFAWMARAAAGAESRGELQIVFGVEGERDLTEHELRHLRGYGGSAPVRVGNDAWMQTQLDVHGEVLACAHLLREQLEDMEPRTARFLRALADLAARRWREPDSGIWEGREGERHYVSSKLMCWVALDRALDMAGALGASAGDAARWERERASVRQEILERGWCEEAGAYTGAFGSDHLDASVLLMPITGFVEADDERMLATIEAVERELGQGGLVRRWSGADDGAFLLCSFWLADCWARAGRVERACEVFEAAAGTANDLGLMSEEADPGDGRMLGNFPQGLSHVGAISAAWSIDRARRAAGVTTGSEA